MGLCERLAGGMQLPGQQLCLADYTQADPAPLHLARRQQRERLLCHSQRLGAIPLQPGDPGAQGQHLTEFGCIVLGPPVLFRSLQWRLEARHSRRGTPI